MSAARGAPKLQWPLPDDASLIVALVDRPDAWPPAESRACNSLAAIGTFVPELRLCPLAAGKVMSDDEFPDAESIQENIARLREEAAWLRRRLAFSAVGLTELDAMTTPAVKPEHVSEFLAWLRAPPRGWEVSDPSKIQITDRALTSFVAEHGAPKGGVIRTEAGATHRDALWWDGFAARDYGAYRLIYKGD